MNTQNLFDIGPTKVSIFALSLCLCMCQSGGQKAVSGTRRNDRASAVDYKSLSGRPAKTEADVEVCEQTRRDWRQTIAADFSTCQEDWECARAPAWLTHSCEVWVNERSLSARPVTADAIERACSDLVQITPHCPDEVGVCRQGRCEGRPSVASDAKCDAARTALDKKMSTAADNCRVDKDCVFTDDKLMSREFQLNAPVEVFNVADSCAGARLPEATIGTDIRDDVLLQNPNGVILWARSSRCIQNKCQEQTPPPFVRSREETECIGAHMTPVFTLAGKRLFQGTVQVAARVDARGHMNHFEFSNDVPREIGEGVVRALVDCHPSPPPETPREVVSGGYRYNYEVFFPPLPYGLLPFHSAEVR